MPPAPSSSTTWYGPSFDPISSSCTYAPARPRPRTLGVARLDTGAKVPSIPEDIVGSRWIRSQERQELRHMSEVRRSGPLAHGRLTISGSFSVLTQCDVQLGELCVRHRRGRIHE